MVMTKVGASTSFGKCSASRSDGTAPRLLAATAIGHLPCVGSRRRMAGAPPFSYFALATACGQLLG